MHIHMYTCIYLCTQHMHTYMHIHIHPPYMYTHTHIHTHTHTYIYIYIFMGWPAAETMCGDRPRTRHPYICFALRKVFNKYDVTYKDVQWPSHFSMTSLQLLRELTMTIKPLMYRRYNTVKTLNDPQDTSALHRIYRWSEAGRAPPISSEAASPEGGWGCGQPHISVMDTLMSCLNPSPHLSPFSYSSRQSI